MKSFREEFQVVKREREFKGFWVEFILRGKKGKGKYHLFYKIKAVGKIIWWGRGEWDWNFGEENQFLFQMRVEKNIKLQGTSYIPVIFI